MTAIRLLPFALLSIAVAAACGSKPRPSNCGGSGTVGPQDTMCTSCLQGSCNAEASSAFGSGFTSGDFSGGACASYLDCAANCACDQRCILACTPDSACQGAIMTFSTCQEAHCASACSTQGSGSSSSGGTGTVDVACYTASSFECVVAAEPAVAASAAQMGCTQAGGVASDTCPTSGLLGCCGIASSKICYYQGGSVDAATAQMQCMQGGGTWSTTP
jgi:hypothetical protein